MASGEGHRGDPSGAPAAGRGRGARGAGRGGGARSPPGRDGGRGARAAGPAALPRPPARPLPPPLRPPVPLPPPPTRASPPCPPPPHRAAAPRLSERRGLAGAWADAGRAQAPPGATGAGAEAGAGAGARRAGCPPRACLQDTQWANWPASTPEGALAVEPGSGEKENAHAQGLTRKRPAAGGAPLPGASPPKAARTDAASRGRGRGGAPRPRGAARPHGAGPRAGLPSTFEFRGLPQLARPRFRAVLSGAPGGLLVAGRVPDWLHGRLRGARGVSLPPRNFPRVPFSQMLRQGGEAGPGLELDVEVPGLGAWRFGGFRPRAAAWGSESQDCYEGRPCANAEAPAGAPAPLRVVILPDGPPYEILPEQPAKRPKRLHVSCVVITWLDGIN